MPILGSLAANPLAGFFNVKDYGAIGDNSHDDTANIQTAINAIKAAVNPATGSAGGNTLYFPPGFYRVSGTLNFTGLMEVRVLGYCGKGGWRSPDDNPPTCINYGNGGSTTVVNMSGSQGCIWDGVSIWATSASYSGVLLNLDTLAASDVFGHRVQNCQLKALSGSSAVLLSLAGNIETSVDNVTFGDAGASGTQVRMVNPSAPAHWSNANSFRSCSFISGRQYSVLNPGPQTTFFDCTFEPNGNAPAPIAFTALGNEPATVVNLTGCGFWDVTSTSGSWFTSTVRTSAWSLVGCKFSLASAAPLFTLADHHGLALIGCDFDSPNGGTPSIFDPGHNIANGVMLGCEITTPVVDNHAAVFV